MILFSGIVFSLSVFSISALFAMKHWEQKHDRQVAEDARAKLDARALHVKELLIAGRHDMANVPPLLLHATQRTLHGIAVDFARLSYALGTLAHRLADNVSHQRHFVRRETRSEFLKKVSEGVSGESGSLDERQ